MGGFGGAGGAWGTEGTKEVVGEELMGSTNQWLLGRGRYNQDTQVGQPTRS